MKYIPKKCVKTNLSGELKNMVTLIGPEKILKKIFLINRMSYTKTWQHLYRLDLWNVAVSSGRFIYMVSSITMDTTTFTRRCDTPRLIVPRFFDHCLTASSPALLHFSTFWIPSIQVQCCYCTSGNHSHLPPWLPQLYQWRLEQTLTETKALMTPVAQPPPVVT